MGTKERQDRERQAVTDSILSAARDLFVAEGYQSVSIRKIAERVKLFYEILDERMNKVLGV